MEGEKQNKEVLNTVEHILQDYFYQKNNQQIPLKSNKQLMQDITKIIEQQFEENSLEFEQKLKNADEIYNNEMKKVISQIQKLEQDKENIENNYEQLERTSQILEQENEQIKKERIYFEEKILNEYDTQSQQQFNDIQNQRNLIQQLEKENRKLSIQLKTTSIDLGKIQNKNYEQQREQSCRTKSLTNAWIDYYPDQNTEAPSFRKQKSDVSAQNLTQIEVDNTEQDKEISQIKEEQSVLENQDQNITINESQMPNLVKNSSNISTNTIDQMKKLFNEQDNLQAQLTPNGKNAIISNGEQDIIKIQVNNTETKHELPPLFLRKDGKAISIINNNNKENCPNLSNLLQQDDETPVNKNLNSQFMNYNSSKSKRICRTPFSPLTCKSFNDQENIISPQNDIASLTKEGLGGDIISEKGDEDSVVYIKGSNQQPKSTRNNSLVSFQQYSPENFNSNLPSSGENSGDKILDSNNNTMMILQKRVSIIQKAIPGLQQSEFIEEKQGEGGSFSFNEEQQYQQEQDKDKQESEEQTEEKIDSEKKQLPEKIEEVEEKMFDSEEEQEEQQNGCSEQIKTFNLKDLNSNQLQQQQENENEKKQDNKDEKTASEESENTTTQMFTVPNNYQPAVSNFDVRSTELKNNMQFNYEMQQLGKRNNNSNNSNNNNSNQEEVFGDIQQILAREYKDSIMERKSGMHLSKFSVEERTLQSLQDIHETLILDRHIYRQRFEKLEKYQERKSRERTCGGCTLI